MWTPYVCVCMYVCIYIYIYICACVRACVWDFVCNKYTKEVKTDIVVAESGVSTPLVVKPAIEHVVFASSRRNCFPKTHLDKIVPSVLSHYMYTYSTFFLWSLMYSFLVSPILVTCLALHSLLDFTVSRAGEGMNRAADGSNRPPFPESTNSVEQSPWNSYSGSHKIVRISKVHYHV